MLTFKLLLLQIESESSLLIYVLRNKHINNTTEKNFTQVKNLAQLSPLNNLQIPLWYTHAQYVIEES